MLCLGISFQLPRLWNILTDFVMDGGNGEHRLKLWSSALNRLLDRPISLFVGLGPGGHTDMYMRASGNETETHNTYVQIAMNSGILILAYYITTIIMIIRRPFAKNTYLVLAVTYFILYGFGGNMNRRVLVWFTYAICWILFKKTQGMEVSRR